MSRALVIVDLQNEFLSAQGRYPVDESSKQILLTNLPSLVPNFRKNGHIVWILSNYANTGITSESQSSPPTSIGSDAPDAFLKGTHTGRSPCCESGSFNAELFPEVAKIVQGSDAILIKTWYSAFKETKLLDDLRRWGVTDLYFCGLLTNICVLASVMDAVKIPDFKVHVVEDALGWRRQTSNQKALEKMMALGVSAVKGSDIVGAPVQTPEAGSLVPSEGVLTVPQLYYVNGSIPSWRVQMALYEKGIDVDLIRLRVMTVPKPTRQPAFLAINPRGKTPVFIDTDKERTKVNESLAILLYLETFYPDRKALLPPLEQRSYRARILSLIQETENLHTAYDALEDAFFESRRNNEPKLFISTIRPPILKSLFEELKFWETYAVKSKRFIGGGEEFTLADCAFYPILAFMLRRGFELDESRWPGLKKYHEAVWDMESAKRAQPEGNVKINVFKGT